MERLVGVVQELSQARDVDTVVAIVRDAARELTGADGATFVLRDDNRCYYVDENAISPLWKGRRFPMESCISGWVMLNARPAVIEDIYADPRIPADAYRPTFVKSLAMVPIRRNAPIGAIGNYWATRRLPGTEEVALLQALADTTSVALENAQLYGELRARIADLQERETRIARQRDSLEVFTRALAHDLKEPVRTLRSFAQLLGNEEIPEEKAASYRRFVRDAAERMGLLIERVSQYIRLDDLAPRAGAPIAMEQVLATVRENLAAAVRERQAVITAEPLPELRADATQMIELLQNLVANAVRYGRPGVAVHVSAGERDADWLFAVHDDGPGIPPEYIEKIFTPFKRLHHDQSSSGLGLAICRKIVEAYKGTLWCESREGGGASFFFTLAKSEIAAPAASAQAPRPDTLANVLLVDDTESDVELTRILLVENGGLRCNLLVACDGTEALTMLRDAAQGGPAIDLVLLDINMPRMDGFELLEAMRGHEGMRQVPVVMCTGSSYEKDSARAASLGAAGYLVKPPSFAKLQPMLEGIASLAVRHADGAHLLMRA